MLVRIICGFTIGVLMSWRPIMPTLVATIGFLFNVCMNYFSRKCVKHFLFINKEIIHFKRIAL